MVCYISQAATMIFLVDIVYFFYGLAKALQIGNIVSPRLHFYGEPRTLVNVELYFSKASFI